MRLLILTIGLIGLLGFSAQAQDTPIETVIAQQIEAFEADDFDTAFTFASPMIQRMFETAENFGSMVQNGYPMVWRPAEVAFIDQMQKGSATWQRLRITDQQGRDHWFAYEMVLVDGVWRINGVFRIEAPDMGV